jgi:hypothetical protein
MAVARRGGEPWVSQVFSACSAGTRRGEIAVAQRWWGVDRAGGRHLPRWAHLKW